VPNVLQRSGGTGLYNRVTLPHSKARLNYKSQSHNPF
jgi:hypothetical protein